MFIIPFYSPEQITDAMILLGFDTDQICNLLATLEAGHPVPPTPPETIPSAHIYENYN